MTSSYVSELNAGLEHDISVPVVLKSIMKSMAFPTIIQVTLVSSFSTLIGSIISPLGCGQSVWRPRTC